MLASVNGLLTFAGRPEWRAKFLKRQRAAFCDERRELRRAEYEKLVATARREKKTRLTLMMETICSTGIRVSELAFVTVEAVRAGRAELMLKGKCRRILFPRRSCASSRARGGAAHSARPDIHRQDRQPRQPPPRMVRDEKLGARAGVAASKVFPHNLPPPLRAHLLRARARPVEARGPSRPQQRRDDAPIHNHRGRRTLAPARQMKLVM